jgi:hypothetical protein
VSEDAPEVVATPIPVQDQGQIIVIETLMPTATPTATPLPTAVVEVVEEPTVAPAEPTAVLAVGGDVDSGSEQEPEEQGNGSLWWLLALPLVIIAGGVVIARRKHINRPDHTDSAGGQNEG